MTIGYCGSSLAPDPCASRDSSCGFACIPPWQCNDHGRLNAPMRVRQGRLGQEKAETTLGYTHAIGEDDRRVADEIGNILCSSLPKSSEVKVGKQVPAQ
jgi:hypothetical protein